MPTWWQAGFISAPDEDIYNGYPFLTPPLSIAADGQGASCGECFELVGPMQSIRVMVSDVCDKAYDNCQGVLGGPLGGPSYPMFDVDDNVFASFAGRSGGEVALSWRKVACDISANVSIFFNSNVEGIVWKKSENSKTNSSKSRNPTAHLLPSSTVQPHRRCIQCTREKFEHEQHLDSAAATLGRQFQLDNTRQRAITHPYSYANEHRRNWRSIQYQSGFHLRRRDCFPTRFHIRRSCCRRILQQRTAIQQNSSLLSSRMHVSRSRSAYLC